MTLITILIIFIAVVMTADTCETLHFDDIPLTQLYGNITRPYHNFIFEHNDGSWMNPHIGLINTVFEGGIGPFKYAAPSLPNALVTSSDLMYLHRNRTTTFDFISVETKAIALNQDVHIEWDGPTYRIISLQRGETTLISLNLTNITYIEIGCKILRIEEFCGPILFDNFRLCY